MGWKLSAHSEVRTAPPPLLTTDLGLLYRVTKRFLRRNLVKRPNPLVGAQKPMQARGGRTQAVPAIDRQTVTVQFLREACRQVEVRQVNRMPSIRRE